MTYIHTENVHNKIAAREIVPALIELINPKSVIDIGCGIGTWLSVFKENGIEDILGIDGNYVDRKLLKIDLDKFISHDLNNLLKEPISISRKFDLTICLEVAEHLSEANADSVIQTLTSLSDVVVFSAAILNQGGQGHLNEQYPIYWQDKFRRYNFELFDSLRWKLWENKNIDWWYKQNIFIGVKSGLNLPINQMNFLASVVHPELYNWRIQQLDYIDSRLKDASTLDISLNIVFKLFLKTLRRDMAKIFIKNS